MNGTLEDLVASEIKPLGLELALQILPSERVSLYANYAYTRASFRTAAEIFSIQLYFYRTRGGRTVIDRHLFTVLTIHSNVQHRATLASAQLELEQL